MTDSGLQQTLVDQSNDLVPVTLGLMHFLDELAYSMDQHEPVPGAIAGDDELVLAALLGMLSIRQTLHRWVDPIVFDGEIATEQDAPGKAMNGEGLLR